MLAYACLLLAATSTAAFSVPWAALEPDPSAMLMPSTVAKNMSSGRASTTRAPHAPRLLGTCASDEKSCGSGNCAGCCPSKCSSCTCNKCTDCSAIDEQVGVKIGFSIAGIVLSGILLVCCQMCFCSGGASPTAPAPDAAAAATTEPAPDAAAAAATEPAPDAAAAATEPAPDAAAAASKEPAPDAAAAATEPAPDSAAAAADPKAAPAAASNASAE